MFRETTKVFGGNPTFNRHLGYYPEIGVDHFLKKLVSLLNITVY